MTQELQLEPSSGTPIYQQIVDQLRSMIARGDLASGAELPSVRSVATRLSVNPMTVSKAYSLLEREGLVLRRPGVGMFVSSMPVAPEELVMPRLETLVEEAQTLGLSLKQITTLLEKNWRNET